MFYVVGTHEHGFNAILDKYQTLERARAAIVWQGQPRGELDWCDAGKTEALVQNNGRRYNYKTLWNICEPTQEQGVFKALASGELIETQRGAYTVEAYEKITSEAIK